MNLSGPLVMGAILVLALVAIFLVIRTMILGRRLRAAAQRLDEVFGRGIGADWENLARRLNERADGLERRLDDVETLAATSRRLLGRAVTRLGAVRFSAYDGEGPDLSFSVAMVDEEGTGMVLTGLYGREETRLYLKPLERGRSRHPLAKEETAALTAAMEGSA